MDNNNKCSKYCFYCSLFSYYDYYYNYYYYYPSSPTTTTYIYNLLSPISYYLLPTTTSTYYYLVPSTSSTLATTLLPPTTTRFCSSYVYFMVSRVPLPVPARLSLLLLLGVCTRPNSRHKKLARRQTTKHHFQLQS